MNDPLVSVILPTRNGLPFLAESVESILRQTFRNLELIIVDDGSTDGTENYLRSLDDSRVRTLRNQRSVGVASSLNFGVERARGALIARMDADDVAEDERIEKQVGFLDHNEGVAIVGAAATEVDESGGVVGRRAFPTSDMAIRWQMAFGCPFLHPSVMMRRRAFDKAGRYGGETSAQDYALWIRIAREGLMANLSDPLLRYRVHAGAVTATKVDEQVRISATCAARYAAGFGVDAEAHRGLFLFLYDGRVDEVRSQEMAAAYCRWCKLFPERRSDADTGIWVDHAQRRLRWHCLEHARRAIGNPRRALEWVRLAGQFDPDEGTIGRIGWRAVRKFLSRCGPRRSQSNTNDGEVRNVVGVG